MPLRVLVVVITTLLFSYQTPAEPSQDQLTKDVLSLDTRLFTAFNEREIEVMKAMLSQDLEFYHDKAGVTNYQQNLKATQNMFNSGTDLSRELLPEFNEVHPIPGYGAIQTGQHRFCHSTENGEPDCGVFKFLHIWKQQDGHWQITRVVSYDH